MTRYRSTPLVFDLMEPFRPLVDMMLAEFMAEPDMSMKAWAKKVGTELRERRVAHERYSLKLMDASLQKLGYRTTCRPDAARALPAWTPPSLPYPPSPSCAVSWGSIGRCRSST